MHSFTIFMQGDHIPTMHVLGNHCIDTIDRSRIMELLRIPVPGYYSRQLCPSWRLIILDTTEMSGHSRYPADSQQGKEAEEYISQHPLSEERPHMHSWNGGITTRQMAWLKQEISNAEKDGSNLIVAAHHQICPGAARSTHLAWNYEEILSTVRASRSVRIFLAGHDHMGGYAALPHTPSSGGEGLQQHFLTMQSILEAPSGSNAYGMLKLSDRSSAPLELVGHGSVPSRSMP